jgi:hypothetical protein
MKQMLIADASTSHPAASRTGLRGISCVPGADPDQQIGAKYAVTHNQSIAAHLKSIAGGSQR